MRVKGSGELITAVYAVVLGPAEPRCILGRPREDHFRLLTRCKLLPTVDSAPRDFIMGRYRQFPDGKTVVDVCSDYWRGKTGDDGSPLAKCTPAQRRAFETAISAALPGPIYVIERGFEHRVPSIDESDLRRLLKDSGPGFHLLGKPTGKIGTSRSSARPRQS